MVGSGIQDRFNVKQTSRTAKVSFAGPLSMDLGSLSGVNVLSGDILSLRHDECLKLERQEAINLTPFCSVTP